METPEAASTEPHTKVAFIFGFLITLTALMLTFFTLRIYARLSIIGIFGVEDWLVAGAVLGILVESVDGCVSTKYGAGYHIQDFKPEWVVPYAKTSFISGAVFPICVAFPKLSLCIMYLRIFPSNANRIFCYTALMYLICWLISTTLVTLFACRPIAAAWNPTIPNASCITSRKFYLASGALNSLSDFLVFLWPARTLWKIQLPVKQRLGLITVFASGCIVCITAVIRLVYLEKVFTSPDFAYNGAIIWVTTSVEMNVGIICSCLHAVKPLLKVWFPNTFGSSNNRNTSYPNNKPRSYGIISDDQSFPFQSLGGGGDGGTHLPIPAAVAKNPFNSRTSPSSSTKDNLSTLPPNKEYTGTNSNRVWASTGDGTGTTPTHGISYTQSVTIDSRLVAGSQDSDIERASRRSGDEGIGPRREIRDADSEEWIMDDQGGRRD